MSKDYTKDKIILNDQINDLNAEIERKKKEIEALNKVLNEKNKEIDSLNQTKIAIGKINKELENSKNQLTIKVEELNGLLDKDGELQKRIDELNRQLKDKPDSKHLLEAISKLTVEIQENNKRVSKLQEERNSLEEKLKKYEKEINDLKNSKDKLDAYTNLRDYLIEINIEDYLVGEPLIKVKKLLEKINLVSV